MAGLLSFVAPLLRRYPRKGERFYNGVGLDGRAECILAFVIAPENKAFPRAFRGRLNAR